MKAAHQLWNQTPTAEDITYVVPAGLTEMLLEKYYNHDDLFISPNAIDISTEEILITEAKKWLSNIWNTPGAIILKPAGAYADTELRLLYAITSRSLGYLNNRYGYFFDVMDRGLDYTKEAIPVSKTKAETGFHTDSTAKNYLPDIVGLLCLQPALQGGESLITNAANLLNHLYSVYPEYVDLLESPLYRDVITPGTTQNTDAVRANDIPLFQFDKEDGVIFRYMRYWIESALEKLQEPTPIGLTEMLNAIDAFFSLPENTLCFKMDRGDILFVNNRFLCHNRTAFTDGDKPRVFVRAWINQSPQD